MLKKALVIILGLGWMIAHTAVAQEVVSFKEWKKSKVLEVQATITQLEAMEKQAPAQFGQEELSRLKQARTNLDITKDLNAQDYFVLYLSPRFQNDQQAYTKAVQMMTPEEIAEILLGYDRVIKERRKKNLLPLDSAKFGFNTPKKMEPEQVLSAIGK